MGKFDVISTPATRGRDRSVSAQRGWQQRVTQAVENTFFWNQVWPNLSQADQVLRRSQWGPLASSTPSEHGVQDSQSFRVLLCRRFRLPILLCSRTCRCVRLLDIHGHHPAACAQAGVLGRRGFLLECAAAQVCREVGELTNVFVRDLDIADHVRDGRRLEVVADGLTLWRRAQLAKTGGEGGRARLVVLAAEVGGRWSGEIAQCRGSFKSVWKPHGFDVGVASWLAAHVLIFAFSFSVSKKKNDGYALFLCAGYNGICTTTRCQRQWSSWNSGGLHVDWIASNIFRKQSWVQ